MVTHGAQAEREPVWVDDLAALTELAATLAGSRVFAFDTEFHRERTYWPQAALIQVAWPEGLALIDPLAMDLAPLAEAFSGDAIVVAHAALQDREVVLRACGRVPATLFDTQIAAGFLGFSAPSLATLVQHVLAVSLPKADRLSDWRRRPLTETQRHYATADVSYLLSLAELLIERLEALGRLEWAREECAAVYRGIPDPQDPETAWWKIKEVRHLRGRARAVAQEVAAWRERAAARLDRPVRTVLADLGIVALAHDPPSTVAQLKTMRGVEGRIPRGAAAGEILDAVARGLALDPSAVRSPPLDEVERHLRPATTLVSAWAGQLAKDLRIDPGLLATRHDLHQLLRGDTSGRLSRGWRADLVGEPIARLVSGEAALAFDGQGGLVLEERSGRRVAAVEKVPAIDWSASATRALG